MLAYHIEAPFLRLDYVVAQGFVSRRSVESVRPPSLVERAEVEELLAVEGHPLAVFPVLAYGDFAHCGVAVHAVDDLAVAADADTYSVEIRTVRRPQFRFFYAYIQLRFAVDAAGLCAAENLIARLFRVVAYSAFEKFDSDDVALLQILSCDFDLHAAVLYIGNCVI